VRAVPEILAKPPDLLEARTQRLEKLDSLGGQFEAAVKLPWRAQASKVLSPVRLGSW
jgi:hypothetical protein